MDYEARLADARRRFECGEDLDDITRMRLLQANRRAIEQLLSNLMPSAPPPNPPARLRFA